VRNINISTFDLLESLNKYETKAPITDKKDKKHLEKINIILRLLLFQ